MRYLAISICLVIGCISAVVGIIMYQHQAHWRDSATKQEKEVRKMLAFKSLEHRIPKGKAIGLSKALSKDAEERLESFEGEIEALHSKRSILLKALHEKTQNFFVNSPGFGSERGLPQEEGILLIDYFHPNDAAKQPGLPASFPESFGELLEFIKPGEDHYYYHNGSMELFLWPGSFGYFKDIQHVAGFTPHGFRSSWGAPVYLAKNWRDQPFKWRTQHILLVGLLQHDQPIVYLSDKLPSMDQVRDGKTRALDLFEGAGLTALKNGEDLYLLQKDDTLRMFGALRATKQCLNCHNAEKGDLLGAFSYTLRLEKPAMP